MRIVFQLSSIYGMALKEGYIPIKGILFDLHGQKENHVGMKTSTLNAMCSLQYDIKTYYFRGLLPW